MRRHELSNEQWEKIKDLLPPERKPQGGRPAKNNRIMMNQGVNSVSVAEFKSSQPDFCSENTSYALHYSSSIFGWNTVIITSNKTPVNITSDTWIAMNYNSDSSEDGELRLVDADGVDSIETVLEKAQSEGEYTIISWHWVYSNGFVTMCAPCYDIAPGNYYVVWVTKSNNTNVRVRRTVIIS